MKASLGDFGPLENHRPFGQNGYDMTYIPQLWDCVAWKGRGPFDHNGCDLADIPLKINGYPFEIPHHIPFVPFSFNGLDTCGLK